MGWGCLSCHPQHRRLPGAQGDLQACNERNIRGKTVCLTTKLGKGNFSNKIGSRGIELVPQECRWMLRLTHYIRHWLQGTRT